MTDAFPDLNREKLLKEKELLLRQESSRAPSVKSKTSSFAYRLRKLLKIEKSLSRKSCKP